ncbi:phage tail protein, partial [Enterobacter hormaechei]
KNVGGAPGNVMEVGAFGVGLTNFTANSVADANDITFNGFSGGGGAASVNFFDQYAGLLAITRSGGGDGNGFIAQLQISGSGAMAVRGRAGTTWSAWMQTYSTGNTIKASDGTLKAASPVIKLFSDGAYQTNDESEGCTVTRLATGEYLIEGCQGLNSDAAWGGIDGGFDIPTDRNRQPLIWLDYAVNADGSVLVKTYHRTHPDAPAFARNEIDGVSAGDPVDIPRDQFVSVRVEMPADSLYNQKLSAAVLAMTADAGE